MPVHRDLWSGHKLVCLASTSLDALTSAPDAGGIGLCLVLHGSMILCLVHRSAVDWQHHTVSSLLFGSIVFDLRVTASCYVLC